MPNKDLPYNIDSGRFNRGFFSVLVLLVSILVLFTIAGVLVLYKTYSSKIKATPSTPVIQFGQKEQNSVNTDLKSLIVNTQNLYGGALDWNRVNSKPAYKFIPQDVNGLTLLGGIVSTHYDINFSPITSINLGSATVPVKNSYAAFYRIPEVLSAKFNISEKDTVTPVYIHLYEFDRALSDSEKKIVTEGSFFRCENDKAEVTKYSYLDNGIVIYYCNLNLTKEQKKEVAGKAFLDVIVDIYFVERNLLTEVKFDSAYINDTGPYLQDFLSKQFNTNNGLFVESNQVKSVEDLRKFEEMRHRIFDK